MKDKKRCCRCDVVLSVAQHSRSLTTLRTLCRFPSFFLSFLPFLSFVRSLRVEFLLKTDGGYPKDTGITLITLATPGNLLRYNTHRSALRVEFLLKTDSGYSRDVEVTLFTLANPGSSLRFNTHWSAPPVRVSALARSGGPRKMSQLPVSRNSNIERRMDRPKAVVVVISFFRSFVLFSFLRDEDPQ